MTRQRRSAVLGPGASFDGRHRDVSDEPENGERRTCTYNELYATTASVASRLAELIEPGDRVAGWLPNVIETVAAHLPGSQHLRVSDGPRCSRVALRAGISKLRLTNADGIIKTTGKNQRTDQISISIVGGTNNQVGPRRSSK